MNNDRTRRPSSARDKAEALFKPAPAKPAAPVEKRVVIPGAREMVTLRLDSDVLAHFQSAGPGWQDRVNLALRQASGLSSAAAAADDGIRPDQLNSSNDD